MSSNVIFFVVFVFVYLQRGRAKQQEDNMHATMNSTQMISDFHQIQPNERAQKIENANGDYKRNCGWKPGCVKEAKSTTSNNDREDIKFFKKCIAEFYCYEKAAQTDQWIGLPTYKDRFTAYFNDAAKRIERFFIRNNDWSAILDSRKLRVGQTCPNLLYIIAARYHYVVYVLNVLYADRHFGPCKYNKQKKKLHYPNEGECFVVPLHSITCTSDFDIALMGPKSGSLAARFNQFFIEPLGADKFVPGFGKSSEEIFGANIFAFTLEYALPEAVEQAGLTDRQKAALKVLYHLRDNVQFQLQEVVSGIRKMRNYSPRYYNELLMDQAELRSRKTKGNLDKQFNDIVKLFTTIEEKIAGVINSGMWDISFRYQQDMARSMIEGTIETTGNVGVVANSIVEHALAMIFGAEVYHTMGSVRHVFGKMKMKSEATVMTVVDAWVSMLENWADTVKEFNRECDKKSLLLSQCLPKISKNLVRTMAGMKKARNMLPDKIRGNKRFKADLADVDPSIALNWYINVKRMGLDELPITEQGNLLIFLKTFQCSINLSFTDTNVDFSRCLNAIQNEVRKYNRRLFTYITYEHKV